MKLTIKSIFLLALTLVVIFGVFQYPPIGQRPAFHQFADGRRMLGISNFLNVLSNIPFLFIAFYGFILLNRSKNTLATYLIYSTLFLGVLLTAFGSAIYHYNPNNETLVWDRLPMTIIFMSFTCATIAEFINTRVALFLLMPLIFMGAGSVLWWSYTEINGHGDLRLYFLVQFYPILLIPLIMWLYYQPSQKPAIRPLIWVVLWYLVAKLLERWDIPIYDRLGVSGHTLKHLAAAASTWYFVEIYRKGRIIKQGGFFKATLSTK